MSRSKEKHQTHKDAEEISKASETNGALGGEKISASLSAAGKAPAAPPSPADLLAEQTVTIRKLQDQMLRLQADFDNFRKRTLREKTEILDTAASELMLELLPVLDHLQLGIQAALVHKADKAIQEGLQLIFDQLMGVLMKFGLAPFDAEQQVFDPARFEAVSRMASDQEPEGIVLAQPRRGYMLRNKLLRPAQVVVSSGPPKDKPKAGTETGVSHA